MPRGPKPTPITLADDARGKLTDWANRPTSAQRSATRARVALAAADGRTNTAIAAHPRHTRPTVRTWRERFAARRREGRTDEPRPGAPRTVTDAQVEAAVTRTVESRPADATRWGTRTLARDLGLGPTAVGRIGRAFGLKPHLREPFKLSTDPLFVEEVRDVVGLHLDPPAKAIVRCVDEEGQVQALDRTQPIPPPLPGRAGKASHDDPRHGPTSRFAALEAATGEVIGTCSRRHRHQAFVAVLDHLHATVAREPGTAIHVVMDNYGTHKRPRVREWFGRPLDFVPHFTPTSGSWLNQGERFVAQITEQRTRRGSFRNVGELEAAIAGYLRTHNERPKPFVWTKPADLTLRKAKKIAERLAPPPENQKRTSDSAHQVSVLCRMPEAVCGASKARRASRCTGHRPAVGPPNFGPSVRLGRGAGSFNRRRCLLMRLPIIVLLVTVLASSVRGDDPAEWKEFAPKDGRFKVSMPGTPQQKKLDTESDFGKGVLYMNTVEAGKTMYGANYSDFPAEIKKVPLKRVDDSSRDGAVANLEGKLASEKDVKRGEHPGREIRIDVPEGKRLFRVRAYLVEQRLYQVVVFGTQAAATSKAADKFLDSFQRVEK